MSDANGKDLNPPAPDVIARPAVFIECRIGEQQMLLRPSAARQVVDELTAALSGLGIPEATAEEDTAAQSPPSDG